VLGELDRAEFIGPTESLTMRSTGIGSSYDNFGFCMHRARFDDFLRDRAVEVGGTYRTGASVRGVETDLDASEGPRHRLELASGENVGSDFLILADGPQRQVTSGVLDEYLPFDVTDRLSTRETNHIAYQEHRRLPEPVFEEVAGAIKFWWGHMPGHTAYPWIFPNDDNVARIGLTMPIGLDLEDVDDRDAYPLLRPDDDRIPQGSEYIRRLLEQEYGDEYDIESDFPIVEDRGKSDGTETYAISSTRPIDSPTAAGIAVVGGAMGSTSAFHEGGDHTAVRTGAIAGELAAAGDLAPYNDRWKDAIGDELLRNVTFADLCREYGPDDWDRTFATVRKMLTARGPTLFTPSALKSGFAGAKVYYRYKKRKRQFKRNGYVQLTADEYVY